MGLEVESAYRFHSNTWLTKELLTEMVVTCFSGPTQPG